MVIASFASARRKLLTPGFLLLVLVCLATLPLYANDYYVSLVTFILTMTVLAVSWAMFAVTGYMSLATAAFFGIGIMATAFLYGRLPFPVIVVIGGLLAAALAFLIGLVTLRLKGIYFAIFSFGFVMFISQTAYYIDSNILHNSWGHELPLITDTLLYWILGLVVVTLVSVYFIRRSRYGLALLSIGGSEEAAEHMGINTTMTKIVLFTLSSVFMGAAGAIYAPALIHVEARIAFNVFNSFTPILMAIFGGMGTLYGPVVGGIIFGYLDRTLRVELQQYFMLGFGIILIAVILFLPNGIAGLVPMAQERLAKLRTRLWKGGQGEQHANT
jgi:branched-chain amino acid transport system permease protein